MSSIGMDCAYCGERTNMRQIVFVDKGMHPEIAGLMMRDAICKPCHEKKKSGAVPTPAPEEIEPPAAPQEPVPEYDDGYLDEIPPTDW